jgi:ubiquinone/menaquinone biosynthesis C-methylase UbiE
MIPIKTESLAMHIFKKIGMSGIAWSLRRLHVPVDRRALVLEVGAGGNPYPCANVLLDAYETTVERIEQALVKDRPLVIGLAEKLPFKNRSFDFIIASYVLEHSYDTDTFLKELMRVGKSGYIEPPDAFWERINPFMFHRLEVTDVDSVIKIYKKPSWRHNKEVVDLFEKKLNNRKLLEFLSKHPEPVYTRFYWVNNIDYEILNPEVRADWPIPDQASATPSRMKLGMYIRVAVRSIVRWFFSQRYRNKKIDIIDLLACPTCD